MIQIADDINMNMAYCPYGWQSIGMLPVFMLKVDVYKTF